MTKQLHKYSTNSFAKRHSEGKRERWSTRQGLLVKGFLRKLIIGSRQRACRDLTCTTELLINFLSCRSLVLMDQFNDLLQELQSGESGGKLLNFDSPMGGDDGGNTVAPTEVGSELVLVNDASSLCLGKIGETKVCLCLADECNIRSHQRNKVSETVFSGTKCLLVGSGPGLTRGFLTPMLNATSLSAPMIRSLLGRVNEDWGKTFELVAVEEIEDLDAEGNLLELTRTVKRKLLSTPNARRTDAKQSFETSLDKVKRARHLLINGPSAASLRESLNTVKELGKSPPKEALRVYCDGLDGRIDLTVAYCHGMETLIELLERAMKHELLSVEEAVNGTKAIVTMLEGNVGKRAASMEGINPTVWGSISELTATTTEHNRLIESVLRSLVGLKKELQGRRSKTVNFSPSSGMTDATTATGSTPEGDLQVEAFFDQSGFQRENNQGATIMGGVLRTNRQGYQPTSDGWDGNSKGGISSLGGTSGMSQGGAGGLGRNAGAGQGVGSSGSSGGSGGLGGGGNGGGSPGGSSGGGFGSNTSSGSTQGTSGASGSGWSVGGVGVSHGDLDRLRDSVAADIASGRDMMDQLSKRIDRLESSPDGEDTVILNGTVLRTKQDVVGFLESHLGVNCNVPAGAFASPHFLLNEVMLTLGCSMPTLDELTKLKRLNVRAIDLRCSQALMATLPVFFTSSKLSTHTYKSGSTGGRFKAFPNYKEWGIKSDEDGLQFKCIHALEEVCKALDDHIRDSLRGSAILQLAAMEQLAKCKRVVVAIFDFLGDNYTRMMAAFDSTDEAWDLGCFGIHQLFLNDFSVPLSCMRFADFSNAKDTLVTAVWANLRIGAIVDKFNETGILNHPAMSAAQVRFIIQQAKSSRSTKAASDVSVLKDQIKILQDTVKKQEGLLNQLTGKVSQVESRADRACSALNLPADGKKRNTKKKAGEEKE